MIITRKRLNLRCFWIFSTRDGTAANHNAHLNARREENSDCAARGKIEELQK